MYKLVILALAMALTGCGGGGGGSSAGTTNPPAVSILSAIGTFDASNVYIPSLTEGNFAGDGSHHVLVSGHLTSGTTAPKVKIFKLNDGIRFNSVTHL